MHPLSHRVPTVSHLLTAWLSTLLRRCVRLRLPPLNMVVAARACRVTASACGGLSRGHGGRLSWTPTRPVSGLRPALVRSGAPIPTGRRPASSTRPRLTSTPVSSQTASDASAVKPNNRCFRHAYSVAQSAYDFRVSTRIVPRSGAPRTGAVRDGVPDDPGRGTICDRRNKKSDASGRNPYGMGRTGHIRSGRSMIETPALYHDAGALEITSLRNLTTRRPRRAPTKSRERHRGSGKSCNAVPVGLFPRPPTTNRQSSHPVSASAAVSPL